MTMDVVSSAALGTVNVSQAVLDKDLVLKLVLHLCSSLQIKTVIIGNNNNNNNNTSLTLLNGTVLNERNAILRALCGPALHHAVDLKTAILGGHSTSRTSPVSAMALSSLTAWMSAASNVRDESTTTNAVLEQLEPYLKERAFLIPSATPTLADMDLCSVLMTTTTTVTPNVQRWMEATHARMQELMGDSAATIPELNWSIAPAPMPTFFYGTEPFMGMTSLTVNPPTAAGAAGSTATIATTTAATTASDKAPVLTDEQKKAAADKRASKKASTAEKPKPKPTVADDVTVAAMDFRVGKILKAWNHPDSEKLYCEEVDVGEATPRNIASGLRTFYATPLDLEGRLVIVVCNLKSRSLAGFPSHGMVLCASNNDHTKVEFVVPPADSVVGERVVFDGIVMGDPEPDTKVAKKKLFEKVAPDLMTNDQGQVVWKTHKATTTAGAVMAVNGMANAHVS